MTHLWKKIVAIGFTISLSVGQVATIASTHTVAGKVAITALIVFLETIVMAGYAVGADDE